MSGLDARYSRPSTAVNWYGKMTRDREVEGNTHQTSPTSEDVNTYYDYHSHNHPAIGGHLLSSGLYSSASNITHTALERARDNSRTFDQLPSPSALNASIADAIHLSRLDSRTASTKQIPPNYIKHATADNPRIPWTRWHGPRTKEKYIPVCQEKWWSSPAFVPGPSAAARAAATAYSHACHIMETDLGYQLFGDSRCDNFKDNDLECWRYSNEGTRRVSNPGSACARCRAAPAHKGCSISKRRGSKAIITELVARSYGLVPRPPRHRVSKPAAVPGVSYTMNARPLDALEPIRYSSPVQDGCSSTGDWPRVPQDTRRLLNPPGLP